MSTTCHFPGCTRLGLDAGGLPICLRHWMLVSTQARIRICVAYPDRDIDPESLDVAVRQAIVDTCLAPEQRPEVKRRRFVDPEREAIEMYGGG